MFFGCDYPLYRIILFSTRASGNVAEYFNKWLSSVSDYSLFYEETIMSMNFFVDGDYPLYRIILFSTVDF